MKCPNCEKISICSCSNCKARRNLPRHRSYKFNNSNESIICPYCKSSFYIGYLEDLAMKEYNLENAITINLNKG